MSFLHALNPNKVKAELEQYLMCLFAPSKFGKTTFLYDLAKKYYGGDLSKMLLLGTEVGYKALNGIHALPISVFEYVDELDEDEDEETKEEKTDNDARGFVEVIDELIENRKTIPYKLIVIDTITALEDLAEKHIIKRQKIKSTAKIEDISDIAYGKGYNLVADAIYEQIDRLKKAGFGVFIIGHSKTKKVEQRDGSSYDLTTLNCLGKTSDIILRESDLIIYGDLVTTAKKGIAKSDRYLRFRSEGNVICGSRFRHMPDKINNSVDEFLEAFENAVLKEYDNDEKAVEKAKVEQQAETERQAEKFAKTQKVEMTAEEMHAWLKESIGTLKPVQKRKLKGIFEKTLGTTDYTSVEDVDVLKQGVEAVKELIG